MYQALSIATLISVLLIFFLSSPGSAQECTTHENCTSENKYCNVKNKCVKIPYKNIVSTKKIRKSKQGIFNIIAVSDIQLYISECRGNPIDQCIFSNVNPSARRTTLIEAVDLHAKCVESLIDRLKNVKAVFDLGDLVDGTAVMNIQRANANNDNTDEVSEIDNSEDLADLSQFHKRIIDDLNLPGVISLGNHDYQIYHGENAIRTITYLQKRLKTLSKRLKVRNIDFKTTRVLRSAESKKVKFTKGSLAYSVEINGYVFINLHYAYTDFTTAPNRNNEPVVNGVDNSRSQAVERGSTGDPVTNTIVGADSDSGADVHQIEITDVTQWMVKEVEAATAEGKRVILLPHGPQGLKAFLENEDNSKVASRLAKTSISAMIGGHTHDAYGLDSTLTLKTASGKTKKIPIYYIGSSSYQKLISVQFYPKKKKNDLKVVVYDSADGERCSQTVASTTTD